MSDHETRKLRHQLKQANKMMGKQGETIFSLRTIIAFLREKNESTISDAYLNLVNRVGELRREVASLKQENYELRQKLTTEQMF